MGIEIEAFPKDFWISLLAKIKEKESEGLQFEGADASLELFIKRRLPHYNPPFLVENYFVHTSHFESSKDLPVEANVQGSIGVSGFHTAGYGTGPVGALDDALRKGLEESFPQLKKISLVDFKVRIVEMDRGTMAKTRVVIETSDKKSFWRTVGCSQNIIEASMQALIDSFEYFLLTDSVQRRG
jgi:2-isopropylmalate synthase